MKTTALVLPIRFATRTSAVQTTTRQLSRTSVFVCCLEPPEIGARLSMKLYLPGVREAVSAQAVVREVAGPGSEAGFWADFVDLGEAEAEYVAAAIDRRERAAEAKPIGAINLQPAEDPRRAFPRVSARFAVRFATVQDFVLEYAANISAGGLFVETEDPPPLQSVVKVEMQLPGTSAPVQARGRVVHRVTKEQARKSGTSPGMGVQFVEATDEFREKIDAAIEHILEQQK
ncbi:MAG: TIGR02266 family protein [Deltaproteobacteria bacterium]|nr:MAG: TIGR02266 family protein [Deltaproteobacteria bacterium]